MVLRDQLGSLAREVVASIPIAPPADVLVSVEGGRFKTLEENALIEVLTAHGLRPYLSDRGNTQYARLQVAILEQTIAYHGLFDGTFERRIRQTLEARFDKAPGEQVTLVGNFTRESVDSVASQEKWLDDHSPDESGFLDHVFGPFVVISASVVIIYFLFTVRS
ncbi:MAG: hypothetical protein HYY49_06350 [Ignavibacteriales bacterium]|nr:hypothetical protein [Ignavibacteriales bacterium]